MLQFASMCCNDIAARVQVDMHCTIWLQISRVLDGSKRARIIRMVIIFCMNKLNVDVFDFDGGCHALQDASMCCNAHSVCAHRHALHNVLADFTRA